MKSLSHGSVRRTICFTLSAILLLCLLLTATSCKKLSNEDVIGTWKNASSSIVVKRDGSFTKSDGDWGHWRIDGDTLFLYSDQDQGTWAYVYEGQWQEFTWKDGKLCHGKNEYSKIS